MLKYRFVISFFSFLVIFNIGPLSRLKAQEKVLHNVLFSSGLSVLTPAEKSKITRFLQPLDISLISRILIHGYCDDIGSIPYNNILSFNRANSIKNFLIELNIDSGLITNVEGRGKLPLLNSVKEDIEKQRAFNRRTEIIIEKQSRKLPSFLKNKTDSATGISGEKDDNQFFNGDSRIGDKIVFKNILFASGRHELLPAAYTALNSFVKELQINNKYHIIVLGYVCCVPKGQDARDHDTGKNNLSVARAEVIYDFLIKNGIEAERLDFKGLKSDFPTGQADKYDRRVEIEITDIK